jgi:GNAT superfamily N-acetyltransferase
MGKRVKGRKTNAPRDGEGFVYHTLDLMASPAWQGRSIACARLIDFLELEHARHGGKENGSLLAPYTQLVEFGIGRRLIADAIREAEQRGLIRVERGGKKGTAITEVNRFTLTYFWTKRIENGLWHWEEETDDWRTVSEFVKIGAPKCTRTVHHSDPVPVHESELAPSQPLEIATPAVVHHSEPPSISWVHTDTSPKQLGGGTPPKCAAASLCESGVKRPSAAHLFKTHNLARGMKPS